MKTVQEKLEGLEALFSEHPLPESLHLITSELNSLAAYAGVAEGVAVSLREELRWTAGLMRDCWLLMAHDRSAAGTTAANRSARGWSILGALLDRTQDLMSADPMTLTDFFLDAMSIVLPWVGSTEYVRGTVLGHQAAVSGHQARLEEVLWHQFLDRKDRMRPENAWAEVEKRRRLVKRCTDLIFVKTTEPGPRAATLLLLYLSVGISRINRLMERCKEEGAAAP